MSHQPFSLKSCEISDNEASSTTKLLQSLARQVQSASPEDYSQLLDHMEELMNRSCSEPFDAKLDLPFVNIPSEVTAKLPLAVLSRLVRLRLSSYHAIVASLTANPSSAKNQLTDVISVVTEGKLKTQSTYVKEEQSLRVGTTDKCSDDLLSAVELVITLISHAFSEETDQSGIDDLSKCRIFSKKVLNVLTIKIIKHLLTAKNKYKMNERSSDSGTGSEVDVASLQENVIPCSVCGLHVFCECSPVVQFYEVLLRTGGQQLGLKTVSTFLSWQLRIFLTFEPEVQLQHVIQHQHLLYRSAGLQTALRTVFFKMCVGAGCDVVLSVLDGVVRHMEVNWNIVLPLLVTVLNSSEDAADKINELIQQYLKAGCAQQERELVLLGLLFARQCCREGGHLFPRYPHWFAATFGSSTSSPALGKQEFSFVMELLTELVPFENTLYLRTHATQSIFAPRSCAPVLHDYLSLVRATLREREHELPTVTQDSVEVLEVIEQYSKINRIPKCVLEIIMFKQNHYNNVFLPALLRPRQDSSEEIRKQLVEALWTVRKIPPLVYQRYIDSLTNQASVKNDSEQLTDNLGHLDKLFCELVDRKHEEKLALLPTLSSIADCIELELQSSSPDGSQNTVLDPGTNAADLTPSVRKVFASFWNVFSDLVAETINDDRVVLFANIFKTRLSWLPRLVAVLTGSYSLQLALMQHCDRLLRDACPTELNGLLQRKRQLASCGALLCEVSGLSDSFLPVLSKTAEKRPPAEHILDCLPVYSVRSCWASVHLLKFWLWWHKRQSPSGNEHQAEGPESSIIRRVLAASHCLQGQLVSIMPSLSPLLAEDVVHSWNDCYCSHKPDLLELLQFESSSCSVDPLPLSDSATVLSRPHLVSSRVDWIQQQILIHYTECDFNTVIEALLNCLVSKKTSVNGWSILLIVLQSIISRSEELFTPNRRHASVLAWWQRHCARTVSSAPYDCDANELHLFLSACQCIPPSILCGGLAPAQFAVIAAAFILQVLKATACCYLPVGLTSSLVSAACVSLNHETLSSSTSRTCLAELWHAAAFHWPSIRTSLQDYQFLLGSCNVSESFPELGFLLSCSRKDHTVSSILAIISEVSAELSVHFLLGVVLRATSSDDKFNKSEMMPATQDRTCSSQDVDHSVIGVSSIFSSWGLAAGQRLAYVRLLAKFLGHKIFCEEIPYFPNKDAKIFHFVTRRQLEHLRVELSEVLMINDSLSKLCTVVPDGNIARYFHIFGIIYGSLSCCLLTAERPKIPSKLYSAALQILLQCYAFMTDVHEELNDDREFLRPAKRLRMSADQKQDSDDWLVDYITLMRQSLLESLKAAGLEVLKLLPDSVLGCCDDDLRSAIKQLVS